MKRAILIDGNNLLFRSYYATAYRGSIMKNSKGFPTNALFGFVNMINKILNEENPKYIMVAFDTGKNFRQEYYKDYKAGRIKMPDDLALQFPIAKNILNAMGIKSLELENYEADDIIGTFAKMADIDHEYDATIISSDKDLLQLISSDVDVKLLKSKDHILMNEKTFFEHFGIEPIKIIDLKALEGDASDNIPGVKGIGEKTALTLLQKYKSLEGVYENIEEVKGAAKDKLILGKESAFFSKELATIYKEVPLNMTFSDILKNEENETELNKIYEELEFYSLMKKNLKKNEEKLNITIVNEKLDIKGEYSFYLELDNLNYHKAAFLGASLYDGTTLYYFDKEALILNKDLFKRVLCTYDLKKNKVFLNKLNIEHNSGFDTMIAGYLLEMNVKDDISYLANTFGYDIEFFDNLINPKKNISEEEKKRAICLKSKFLYETRSNFEKKLVNSELNELFNEMEIPLIDVLVSMESTGITTSIDILNEIKEEVKIKLDNVSNNIFNYAGGYFNISSPKQLGEILFEKLGLPNYKKKGKTGYSTNHDVLIKLYNTHPIIDLILEYRELNKIYTTYLESLGAYIMEDSKIHTIFKQIITRTGRLSSTEPNLQNIPIKSDEGKRIRKAFLPEENSIIMSTDYSQIELRLLAHISKDEVLIDAFNNNIDIHTKVASDIFNTPLEGVTKKQRNSAKAVVFGIVYGISGFGLGENLNLTPKEAKEYIDKFLEKYPGVKKYMFEIVESAKEKGYVKTLFGRIRTIDELKNTNYIIRQSGERIALNTPLQGSQADIIKKAMIDIYNEMNSRNLKSKMILQVHDELIFNVIKEEFDEVKELVTSKMENAYKIVVPLLVETTYGNNWYEAK